jgi:hypothetical protein
MGFRTTVLWANRAMMGVFRKSGYVLQTEIEVNATGCGISPSIVPDSCVNLPYTLGL